MTLEWLRRHDPKHRRDAADLPLQPRATSSRSRTRPRRPAATGRRRPGPARPRTSASGTCATRARESCEPPDDVSWRPSATPGGPRSTPRRPGRSSTSWPARKLRRLHRPPGLGASAVDLGHVVGHRGAGRRRSRRAQRQALAAGRAAHALRRSAWPSSTPPSAARPTSTSTRSSTRPGRPRWPRTCTVFHGFAAGGPDRAGRGHARTSRSTITDDYDDYPRSVAQAVAVLRAAGRGRALRHRPGPPLLHRGHRDAPSTAATRCSTTSR